MTKRNIIIFTGKIKSGKSTALLDFAAQNPEVCGVIQIGHNESREFVFLPELKRISMIRNDDEKKWIKLGDYDFSQKAFSEAIVKLHECLNGKSKIVVIDEFGKMEFDGFGFFSITKQAIEKAKIDSEKTFIIVVRESLLEAFLSEFNLNNNVAKVIRELDFA